MEAQSRKETTVALGHDGQGGGGGTQARRGGAVGHGKERRTWSGRGSTFASAAFCHYLPQTCPTTEIVRKFTFTVVVSALLSFAVAQIWRAAVVCSRSRRFVC